jgi:hypothetical protein
VEVAKCLNQDVLPKNGNAGSDPSRGWSSS